MLYYCKKCGRIIFFMSNKNEKICDCCKSKVYPIPKEYEGMGSYKKYQYDLWNKYVKTSPEFNQYLFNHRDEILAKQSIEFNNKMEHGKSILKGTANGNKLTVECPYCHATDTKKISGASKAGSIALFGFFAMPKASKQWHCNKCKSDF